MRIIALLAVLALTSSFSLKEGRHKDQLLPTKLRITIIDNLGNLIEGAEVSIYATKEDYQGSVNAVQTLITDKKGRVTFKEVEPVTYFVEAKKKVKDNEYKTNNGEGVQTNVLSEGKINKVNIVIR